MISCFSNVFFFSFPVFISLPPCSSFLILFLALVAVLLPCGLPKNDFPQQRGVQNQTSCGRVFSRFLSPVFSFSLFSFIVLDFLNYFQFIMFHVFFMFVISSLLMCFSSIFHSHISFHMFCFHFPISSNFSFFLFFSICDHFFIFFRVYIFHFFSNLCVFVHFHISWCFFHHFSIFVVEICIFHMFFGSVLHVVF